MDSYLTGVISIVVLLILLLLGFHVAAALGLVGFVGIMIVFGFDPGMGLLLNVPFNLVSNFHLSAIPLFILMGHLAIFSGIGQDLYQAAYRILGRIPGSLAMSTAASGALFGAASGSTLASATLFTRLAYPEMKGYGYNKGFSLACIASASGLAVIIPPSIVIIMYCIITGTSVGKTLVAGFIPGIICASLFMVMIYVRARIDPTLCPAATGEAEPWKKRLGSLVGIWPILVILTVIMGGIYFGVFTATESAGIGALATLVLALARRRLSLSQFSSALLETAQVTSMIFLILIGATLFSNFLALSGFIATAVGWVAEADIPPLGLVMIIIIMYLLLGCIIDGLSMLLVTLPFVFPMIKSAGYDPVWFGIICAIMVGVAVITPPLGIDVYAVKALVGKEVEVEDIFRHVFFFVALYLIVVFFLVMFPQIVMWLPNMMW